MTGQTIQELLFKDSNGIVQSEDKTQQDSRNRTRTIHQGPHQETQAYTILQTSAKAPRSLVKMSTQMTSSQSQHNRRRKRKHAKPMPDEVTTQGSTFSIPTLSPSHSRLKQDSDGTGNTANVVGDSKPEYASVHYLSQKFGQPYETNKSMRHIESESSSTHQKGKNIVVAKDEEITDKTQTFDRSYLSSSSTSNTFQNPSEYDHLLYNI